jgi:hypothetical protein
LLAAASAIAVGSAISIHDAPLDVSGLAAGAASLDFASAPMAEIPPPGSDQELLARPLFSASRRPYVPPPADAPPDADPVEADPPAAAPAEDLSLAGVFIHGGERKALLVSPSYPEGRWFAVGTELGDERRLTSIAPMSVQLRTPTEYITLQLYVDSHSPQ